LSPLKLSAAFDVWEVVPHAWGLCFGASASADYGSSGKTGGLSGLGKAKVEDFGEEVAASADGNPSPARPRSTGVIWYG